ncbi:hypothetical protein L2E82_17296 [Cichorium intybus]|uniref:Uncharacterized protein n=1 Tax=Cichorium intybus TaxID=13427 RepID=A0ACB9F8V1_CICIN|nr:hypothetical protein L2E82_17296 [Cichorium intybus]
MIYAQTIPTFSFSSTPHAYIIRESSDRVPSSPLQISRSPYRNTLLSVYLTNLHAHLSISLNTIFIQLQEIQGCNGHRISCSKKCFCVLGNSILIGENSN